jgi:hypothetical protein
VLQDQPAPVAEPAALSQPAPVEPAPVPAPAPPPVKPAPSPARIATLVAPPLPAPPPANDPLADAVAAYRSAVALEKDDPAGAASAWYAWRDHWRESPLAQAAELRLLAVLGRLGRDNELASVASDFLQRFPDSPRRGEVEHLVERSR